MTELNQARNLINSGKPAEAWSLPNNILANNPQNEEAWLLAYQLAKPDASEKLIRKALSFVPKNSKLNEIAAIHRIETIQVLEYAPEGARPKSNFLLTLGIFFSLSFCAQEHYSFLLTPWPSVA